MALSPLPSFPEVPPGGKDHLPHSRAVQLALETLHEEVPEAIDVATRRPFTPKGDWDAAATYEFNDFVHHSDASWIAEDDVPPGAEPGVSDLWQKWEHGAYVPAAANTPAVGDVLVRGDGGNVWQAKPEFDVRDYDAAGDGTTDDTAAVIAAIAAASAAGGGAVLLAAMFGISGRVTVPSNVDLVARGGAGDGGPVGFKALHADAQVMFGDGTSGETRGGLSGGFVIDGNGLGARAGGLLYLNFVVGRTFAHIDVFDAAGDGVVIEQSQNNMLLAVAVARSTGNAWTLDQGAGGNIFIRCNSAKSGGAACEIKETTGTGPYDDPDHNHFLHCIFERGDDTSGTTDGMLVVSAGEFNRFTSCIFSVQAGYTINGADAVIQVTGGVVIFDSVRISGGGVHDGIRQEAGAAVYTFGRVFFSALATAWVYNGGSGSVQGLNYGGVTSRWGGTGSKSNLYSEIHRPLLVTVESDDTRAIRAIQSGDTGARFEVEEDGTIGLGSGTGATDVKLLRHGVDVLRTPDTFVADAGMRVGSATGPRWLSGTGSPEGVVIAPVGSFYSREDGGAGTTWYVKEPGSGSTGWVAK